MGRRGKPQQNLVGQRFNHLTVLEMIPGNLTRTPSVRCQCDCGNIVIAATSNVKSGNTKSCGCIKHGHGGPRPKADGTTVVRTERKGSNGRKTRDLTGQRFNHLIVTGLAGYDKHGHAMYECQCDCGNTLVARGTSLAGDNTKSCGCQRAVKAVKRKCSP